MDTKLNDAEEIPGWTMTEAIDGKVSLLQTNTWGIVHDIHEDIARPILQVHNTNIAELWRDRNALLARVAELEARTVDMEWPMAIAEVVVEGGVPVKHSFWVSEIKDGRYPLYMEMVKDAPAAPPQPVLETAVDVEWLKHATAAMASDLGAIGEALGLDPDDCGADAIIDAIDELRAATPAPQPVLETPTLPKFVVEKVERLIHEALNPKGMHTNGPCYVQIEVTHLQRLLRAALATAAQPVATITPALRKAIREWIRADEGDPDADAALLEAMGAQPVPAAEWVSVDERLPEGRAAVAFVVDCKNERFKYLDGRVLGGTYVTGQGFSIPGMTIGASHWMPLPPPPASHITGASQ